MAIIRKDLNASLLDELCTPDVMVLDLGEFVFINAYLRPTAEADNEERAPSGISTLTRVEAVISSHTELQRPFMVIRDWNARIRRRVSE